MAGITRRLRTEEQRVRQAEVRKAVREARRPDRDGIACLLLWQISGIQDKSAGKREMLGKVRDQIVDGLEVQGLTPGPASASTLRYAGHDSAFRNYTVTYPSTIPFLNE